ncbi:FimA protein [Pseudomonas aeruginosa]|nr:FimA protein [Pseudomonas aeruginosa]
MTFSIVGRCAETGQLGIAISSSSIAVGARCPWLRAGTGAVATQNITLPALGPQILDRLDQGLAPGEALDQALSSNGYGQYRQVTVIDQHGPHRVVHRPRGARRPPCAGPANNAWRPATCWPRRK